MTELQWSQAKAARRLNISPNYVNMIFRGTRKPGSALMFMLKQKAEEEKPGLQFLSPLERVLKEIRVELEHAPASLQEAVGKHLLRMTRDLLPDLAAAKAATARGEGDSRKTVANPHGGRGERSLRNRSRRASVKA